MITAAAIKSRGTTYTGKTHQEILEANPEHPELGIGKFGFVTDKGEFLDRILAAQHAFRVGQIKRRTAALYSDDLEQK